MIGYQLTSTTTQMWILLLFYYFCRLLNDFFFIILERFCRRFIFKKLYTSSMRLFFLQFQFFWNCTKICWSNFPEPENHQDPFWQLILHAYKLPNLQFNHLCDALSQRREKERIQCRFFIKFATPSLEQLLDGFWYLLGGHKYWANSSVFLTLSPGSCQGNLLDVNNFWAW